MDYRDKDNPMDYPEQALSDKTIRLMITRWICDNVKVINLNDVNMDEFNRQINSINLYGINSAQNKLKHYNNIGPLIWPQFSKEDQQEIIKSLLVNKPENSTHFNYGLYMDDMLGNYQDKTIVNNLGDNITMHSFKGTAQSISITPDKPNRWAIIGHKIKRSILLLASIRLRLEHNIEDNNWSKSYASLRVEWNNDPLCDED